MEFETRDEESAKDSFQAIGRELASARLERGIQISELSQLLRISRHYLKDIEAGDHSSLPGPTYVSGYIRSIAREVGLDPDVVTQRYRALLAGRTETPTYQFPIDNQQPQRSGAMIASIMVIFAIAGYGGWYVAGKPDLTAGLLDPAEPEVAVIPQVETTVTEPDNLISREAEGQAVASSAPKPAGDDLAVTGVTDDPAVNQPRAAALPAAGQIGGSDAVLAAGEANTINAGAADTGETAPLALAAVEAPASDGAANQEAVLASQTEIAGASAADAGSAPVAAAVAATEDVTPQVTTLATTVNVADPAGSDVAGSDVAGSDVAIQGEVDASTLSAGDEDQSLRSGVAFARQRLPELEITLRATGISWVEIIRNDGEEVMTKLMRKGEIYVVDSRDKLYLSTGNAGGLELLFHDGSVRSVGESGEILRDLPLDAERLRNQL